MDKKCKKKHNQSLDSEQEKGMTKETSNEITTEIWILDTPIYLLFLKPSRLQISERIEKKKKIVENL